MSEKTGKDRARIWFFPDAEHAQWERLAEQFDEHARAAKIEALKEALDLICLETSALYALYTVLAKLEGK